MKNNYRKMTALFIFITISLGFNTAYAELTEDTKNPVHKVSATLKFKRGDVLFRTADTRFETIEKGQDLFEQDILKTEANSVAILELPDSSKIKVGPSTEIKIEKLVTQIEEQSFEKTSVILRTGKILIDVINKSSEPVLKVKTKNAAIGVRGTRFFISQEHSGDGNLWVAADHGELEVTSLRNKGMTEAIDPGQGLVIDQLGSFTQPQEYKWVKNINYDTEHRTPKFGEYSSQRKQRQDEFKNKRKQWKPNLERLNKRKERWKKLGKRYARKAEKFSQHRKKIRKSKREFTQERRKYFKKRKKLFYKMQDLKQKLKGAKKSDRSKRRQLKESIKELRNDFKTLKKEKRNYIDKVRSGISRFAPNVDKMNFTEKRRRMRDRRRERRENRRDNQPPGGGLPPPPPPPPGG
jgi:hypothetical protein